MQSPAERRQEIITSLSVELDRAQQAERSAADHRLYAWIAVAVGVAGIFGPPAAMGIAGVIGVIGGVYLFIDRTAGPERRDSIRRLEERLAAARASDGRPSLLDL